MEELQISQGLIPVRKAANGRSPLVGEFCDGSFLGTGNWASKTYWLLRFVLACSFSIALMAGMVTVYVLGYVFAGNAYFSIGLYGAICLSVITFQAFFAWRNTTLMKGLGKEVSSATVGIQISAYQEDPSLLRKCLESIKLLDYPQDKLRVLLCIDGNGEDSQYMADIFHEVFRDSPSAIWEHNFHTKVDDGEVEQVLGPIRHARCACIMQQWGGKREAMYTAFNLWGKDEVDYIQVCDSDTVLNPDATSQLARVLDHRKNAGAVVGNVAILNAMETYVTFMSSLRYWIAFHIERSCQSYFGVVGCISGPLGMYRNLVLQELLPLWAEQSFLGVKCTFGDDRHLTNRMMQFGYETLFTPLAECKTETPAEYLRWMNQQLRWTKSYYREWMFNVMWWHKNSLWLVFENSYTFLFPFLLIASVALNSWVLGLWDCLKMLLVIQIIGLIRGMYAVFLSGRLEMLFASMYSALYFTSILPIKVWAIFTINSTGWGTSGRKKKISNYSPLFALTIWLIIVFAGPIYLAVTTQEQVKTDQWYLIGGAISYAVFWMVMAAAYFCCVRRT